MPPKRSMPKLLLKQESLINQIQSLVPHLKLRKNFPPQLLKERLTILKLNWEKCRQINISIELLYEDDLDAELPFFKQKQYYAAETAYENALDFICERLPDEQNSTTTNAESSHRPRLKKPELTIPVFSGIYTDWLYFRELFKSLIIDDASLTDIERFQYLLTSLSGEAQVIVKDISLTGENFNQAWAQLKSRYDHNRMLIEDCLRKLREIPEISNDALNSLKFMRDTTMSVLTSLKTLGRPVDQWDDWLVSLLTSKFDKTTRCEWEMNISEKTDMPTFKEFEIFLQARIRVIEAISASAKNVNINTKQFNKSVKSSSVHTHQTNKKIYCPFCKSDHRIYVCTKFQELSIPDREAFINQESRCRNCLAKGHFSTNCLSKGVRKFCNGKHHHLLHRNNKVNKGESSSTSANALVVTPLSKSPTTNITTHLNTTNIKTIQNQTKSVMLATARVVVEAEDGRKITVRALLDQGSEVCFLSENIVQLLKLPRKNVCTTVSGMGGTKVGQISHSVNFVIKSLFSMEVKIPTRALVISKISDYQPRRSALNHSLNFENDFALADPEFYSFDKIDLLIGADIYGSVLREGIRHGILGSLTAQLTVFGWVLSGPLSSDKSNSHSIQVHHAYDSSLNDTLRLFWEVEEPPNTIFFSKDDEECEKHFNATHSRGKDGRYCVRLPFRQPITEIKESRSMALAYFLRLEKRLEKDSELKKMIF